MVDLASIHKCSLPENGELNKKHWDLNKRRVIATPTS